MSLTPRLDRLDKNYIINGNFDFWQRNTNATGLAGPGYAAADRFSVRGGVFGTAAMSRSTNVPTVSNAVKPNYSFLYSCTATATPAAGDLRAIGYAMEGNDLRQIAGKTFTLSFWVRSFQTGTFGFSIKNGGSTRAYHTTYTIDAANTWEYKTITITHDTTGSWSYDNSSGLELAWILAAGTSFQTSTFNSWTNDTNFRGPTTQPYFYSSTSNYFQLSQVMLAEGDTAVDFNLAGRTYSEELALCQRYYETAITVPGDAETQARDVFSGMCLSATTARIAVPYRVEKRGPTALSLSSASHFIVVNASGGAIATTAIVIETNREGRRSALLAITVAAGLVAGDGTLLLGANSSAHLAFDSEL